MTRANAEKTADIILGVAGLALTLLVFKTPALRRTAFKLGRTALVAGGPWIVKEAGNVWRHSRQA